MGGFFFYWAMAGGGGGGGGGSDFGCCCCWSCLTSGSHGGTFIYILLFCVWKGGGKTPPPCDAKKQEAIIYIIMIPDWSTKLCCTHQYLVDHDDLYPSNKREVRVFIYIIMFKKQCCYRVNVLKDWHTLWRVALSKLMRSPEVTRWCWLPRLSLSNLQ